MAQPQHTPAQVLETARRAEADGQFDYADQAFRHILEVFPTSPEAGLAREAVANRQQYSNGAGERLQDRAPNLAEPAQSQARIPQQTPAPGQPSPLPHTGQASLNSQAANQLSTSAPARPGGNHLQLEPAQGSETTSRSAGFPAPQQRSYPLARLLATLTVMLGILTLLIAALVGAAAVIDPVTTQVLTGTRLTIPNIMLSVGIFASGLALCLVGLLAHAVFHTARNLSAYTAAEHIRHKRRDV